MRQICKNQSTVSADGGDCLDSVRQILYLAGSLNQA